MLCHQCCGRLLCLAPCAADPAAAKWDETTIEEQYKRLSPTKQQEDVVNLFLRGEMGWAGVDDAAEGFDPLVGSQRWVTPGLE